MVCCQPLMGQALFVPGSKTHRRCDVRNRERFWIGLCLLMLVVGWHTYVGALVQLLHFLSTLAR
jgi:hypothetical protein